MGTITKVRARPVEQAQLSPVDIALLQEREELRAELKKLDSYLKPRIGATIDKMGIGKVFIGNNVVELRRSTRLSVSWAALCTSIAEPQAIEDAKGDFIVEHTIDSVKVVES